MIARLPADLGIPLNERLEAVLMLTDEIITAKGARDGSARQAASGLYNVTSAALFGDEGRRADDPLRQSLAHLVLRHRPSDPLAMEANDGPRAGAIIDALIAGRSGRCP